MNWLAGSRIPVVTISAMLVCIGIFFGLARADDYQSWDTLAKFGYLSPNDVWNGAYWGLVTSAFVHFELWHLAFNLYWLWLLGGRMEQAIGSLRYAAFLIAAAAVSSSCQLALSDTTGIGFSGVGYAIFGFVWVARKSYPQLSEVMSPQVVKLFLCWMAACILFTQMQILSVGNAAHVSGLLFGAVCAGFVLFPTRRILVGIGLFGFAAAALTPTVWSPWSTAWLQNAAYEAHADKQYAKAVELYTRIILREPKNAWAWQNRSSAYLALGEVEKATTDFAEARRIDPSIGQEP